MSVVLPKTVVALLLAAAASASLNSLVQAADGSTAAQLGLSPDGKMHLTVDGAALASFSPFAADPNWKFASPSAEATDNKDVARFAMKVGNASIAGESTLVNKDGVGEANWVLTPKAEVTLNNLSVSADFPVATLGGGRWEVDGKTGTFPRTFGASPLFTGGEVRSVKFTFTDGKSFAIQFPKPTYIGMQDNRQWGGPSFTMRINLGRGLNQKFPANAPLALGMSINVPGGVSTFRDQPVTIAASDEWVPLKTELDVIAGSALDFSNQGFTDGPCGSRGRVITTPDGHFAYADDPKTPRRFYGVNLCFSAQYLTKERTDLLLDRLVRLGYNSVRIHHYESGLTNPEWKQGFDWDAEKVDRLDYLVAGCAKRGLWLTTDLYVSRPVPGKQIGLTGDTPQADRFKRLVPVHEPAFKDWETFTRKFLDRVNPYTGKRLADEPALAWISLINEGGGIDGKLPEWTVAWNRWLATKYPNREDLDLALGNLVDAEDPAKGTVALPENIKDGSRRARLSQVFYADTERVMVERMKKLLREELKCPALITDLNCPPHYLPMQATRQTSFDYVDDHFYVDHPIFPQNQWRLPSTSPNANPIRQGAPGGTSSASLRLWGKPFTISEFDYSGPGRFRGVGGVLTGALAALQDWDVLWRFAYAHRDQDIVAPAPIDYFNLVRDPLNQAADRAAVMLFLRGDLKPAPSRIAVVMPMEELLNPPTKITLDSSSWLAWTTRIGGAVLEGGAKAPADAIAIPMRDVANREAVTAILKEKKIIDPQIDNENVIRSETGQIVIDKSRGVLTIDTDRTAGGYADAGQTVAAAGAGVKVDGITVGATVFVSSLDKNPIRSSTRLLITHLTDLQNTGARYSETARQTLLEWGGLPHVVRDGQANVHLMLTEPAAYKVWALSTSGRRLEEIKTTVSGNGLTFQAAVRGADGARMLYEVARQ